MTIHTFKKSVVQARRICEDAATVMELTKEMKPDPTTYVFPAAGVLYGQLVKELRNRCGIRTQITQEGENIRVVTTNPSVAVQVLKQLGISVTVDGGLKDDVHTDTTTTIEPGVAA